MGRLKDIVLYIVRNYPSRRELSKVRLLGMLYLVDWKHALQFGSQLTEIEWAIYNDGPHPDTSALRLIQKEFDNLSKEISIASPPQANALSTQTLEVLDFVISTTSVLEIDAFTRLILSTYPVISDRQNQNSNLGASAKRYKQIQPLLSKNEPEEAQKE